MNACARFEEEGLFAIEAGTPLDPHFEDCPECLEQRDEFDRLGQAVAMSSADDRPTGDWQARVWSEIRRSESRGKRRRLWALLPVALAAALTAVVVLVPRAAEGPAVLAQIEPGGGPVRRGTEAQPGDRLVLEATTGGLAYAELRVYLNDRELILHCGDEPPCLRTKRRVKVTLVLESIGTYQPVFLASPEPLPKPGEGLDADASAAMRAGATVELPKAIEVR